MLYFGGMSTAHQLEDRFRHIDIMEVDAKWTHICRRMNGSLSCDLFRSLSLTFRSVASVLHVERHVDLTDLMARMGRTMTPYSPSASLGTTSQKQSISPNATMMTTTNTTPPVSESREERVHIERTPSEGSHLPILEDTLRSLPMLLPTASMSSHATNTASNSALASSRGSTQRSPATAPAATTVSSFPTTTLFRQRNQAKERVRFLSQRQQFWQADEEKLEEAVGRLTDPLETNPLRKFGRPYSGWYVCGDSSISSLYLRLSRIID